MKFFTAIAFLAASIKTTSAECPIIAIPEPPPISEFGNTDKCCSMPSGEACPMGTSSVDGASQKVDGVIHGVCCAPDEINDFNQVKSPYEYNSRHYWPYVNNACQTTSSSDCGQDQMTASSGNPQVDESSAPKLVVGMTLVGLEIIL